jgi:hypothetical protein
MGQRTEHAQHCCPQLQHCVHRARQKYIFVFIFE